MQIKNTSRLVLYGSAAYLLSVYVYRGIFPTSVPSTAALLAVPLGLLALIVYSDLLHRAKTPTRKELIPTSGRSLNRQVQLLSRQVDVAAQSSANYYDRVLLTRLRELIIEKVSIETGLDRPKIADVLADPVKGPTFLNDQVLYDLLFNKRKAQSNEVRQRTLEIIADRIGEWKA